LYCKRAYVWHVRIISWCLLHLRHCRLVRYTGIKIKILRLFNNAYMYANVVRSLWSLSWIKLQCWQFWIFSL
jgi:hypothetical protein